jgi:hypothetical protein
MSNKTTNDETAGGDQAAEEIRIYVPWALKGHYPLQTLSRINRVSQKSDLVDPNLFLTERSRVHEVYIREQHRTQRLSLLLSAILLLAACFVVVFAPAGREYVASWIGAALLVSAAGAAGYKRIWGKSKNIYVGADQGKGARDD